MSMRASCSSPGSVMMSSSSPNDHPVLLQAEYDNRAMLIQLTRFWWDVSIFSLF